MLDKMYPYVGLCFKIQFKSDSFVKKFVSVAFVLDLNWKGELIGFEIINLKYAAGSRCLENISENIGGLQKQLEYSFDEACDAFYLKISEEISKDQRSVDGIIMLDADGHIIGFLAHLQ